MPAAIVDTVPKPASTSATSTRLMSLDALRGFDMFWIMGGDIFVRSLQKIYPCAVTKELGNQMEHCDWAGFHFYDLIFPLFVFMVGVAITFSVPRMLIKEGRGATIRRIAGRSVVMFALGVLYMGGVSNGFKNVYFAGVLHRIAGAYFFAALMFCFFRPRTLVVMCITLLVGYWALMTFVPVPGIGPATYEQGKNLARWLDDKYMPGLKFEGTILSTTTAVANCLLGVFAGLFLQNDKIDPKRKVVWLIGSGAVSLIAGILWSFQFPIIKLLWTSTYVLVSCGISAMLLGIFYLVIDVLDYKRWAVPFVWIGMNAITIYLTSAVVGFHRLATRFVGGDVAHLLGNWADAVRAIVALVMVFAVCRFLYQRKIFLRL